MKILLDTNAYSALMEGNRNLFSLISKAETVIMSSIVIGELIFGFKCGKRESKNREILERFISKPTVKVVDVTLETDEFYAKIKHNLKKRGTPIPANDIWIAAQTMANGAELITVDRHFQEVEGILICGY